MNERDLCWDGPFSNKLVWPEFNSRKGVNIKTEITEKQREDKPRRGDRPSTQRVTTETRNTNNAVSTAGSHPAPLTSKRRFAASPCQEKQPRVKKNLQFLLSSPLIHHSGKQIGSLGLWTRGISPRHCFMIKLICSVGCSVTHHVSLFVAVTRKLRAKCVATSSKGSGPNGGYFFVALFLLLLPTPF